MCKRGWSHLRDAPKASPRRVFKPPINTTPAPALSFSYFLSFAFRLFSYDSYLLLILFLTSYHSYFLLLFNSFSSFVFLISFSYHSYFLLLIQISIKPHLYPACIYNPQRQICVLVFCCNVSPTTIQFIVMQHHYTLNADPKYRFHDEFETAWSMLSYCDIWTGSSVKDDSIGCSDDLDLGVVWRYTVGWHCDVWSDSLS